MNAPILPKRIYSSLIVCLLALVSFGLYANILQAPFTLDDKPNITENPCIRMTAITPGQIARIFKSPAPNRPLANLTIALNYYFHGYRPAGYHIVNIAIHTFVALMIFLVAQQTLQLCRVKEPLTVSLLAALFWVVHPLHTGTVTYIVQRMTSLATLFYLLALFFYIRARKAQQTPSAHLLKTGFLFTGVIVSGVFGLASKEIVIMLPFIVFIYEWYFFQNLNAHWLKKQTKWIGLAIVLLIIMTFIYIKGNPIDSILSTYDHRGFTLTERLLTEPSIVIFYLSLLFFPYPSRLNLNYDFSLSRNFFTPPSTALAIIAIIILLLGAIIAARKHRLVSFAIIWFLGNLVLESSFIGLELIFEHRTYLPSVFPVIAITTLLLSNLRSQKLAWGLLLAVICLQGAWTIQRNTTWRDEITLWKDCLDKSPERARTLNALGAAYTQAGKPENALAYLKTAIRIAPEFQRAYVSMGNAFFTTGQPFQAIAYYQKAFSLGKASKKACVNMGVALQKTGQVDEAIRYYHYAIELGPYSKAYNNLGQAYSEKGELATAYWFFKKAVQLAPAYTIAWNNLNTLQKSITANERGMQRLKQQLQSQPLNPELLYQLAKRLIAAGRYDKATEAYETLAIIIPESGTVFYNLACLYARQNQRDKAIISLEKAVNNGYNNWTRLKTDVDLDPIRGMEQFQRLMQTAVPLDMLRTDAAPQPDQHKKQ